MFIDDCLLNKYLQLLRIIVSQILNHQIFANCTVGLLKYAHCYLLHDVKWEGTNLFQSVNSNFIIQTSVSPLLDQVKVNLASTEQHL